MNRRSQSNPRADGPVPSDREASRGSREPLSTRSHKLEAEFEAEIALYRQAIEKAREDFQAFAYSVSHDLRAPLRSIEGFSKILLEDYAKELSPEPQRYLKHVVASTQILSAQIDDLLKFYHAGKNPPTKIEVSADAICKESLLELGDQLSDRLSVIQHELPTVLADPGHLREIFSSLLSNAIKFSSKAPEPKIEIGSRSEPGAVTFYVRDNGVGFEMRNAERLFQVFQKLHNATEYTGNGIGLAIVKRLVEAAGGCVSADSQPGKGSVFCFSLPTGVERVAKPSPCAEIAG